MTDHEHKWEVLKPEQSEPEWYIWCPKCGDRMDTIEEINAMLNEHARLKQYVEETCDEDFVLWCREQDALAEESE